MNKSNFKQIFLTLALLITAATGAWAEESESITTTLSEAMTGSVEFTGTHFKITGQRADKDGMNLGSSTKRTITISALNGEIITKVEMTIGFKLYTWEWDVLSTKGNVSGEYTTYKNLTLTDVDVSEVTLSASNTTTGYLQFNKFKIFYTLPAGTVTLNNAKTVATMTMPESDVTVEYSLVRDMIDETYPVEFGGLPASGDIIVKKGDDGKYQPASELTITLIDPLAAADAQNIIDSEDITIQVIIQKENAQGAIDDDPDKEPITLEAFLADMQPGYYRLEAVASETGAYDGTVYSVPLTLIEKYDLAIQPADDFSKDKLSEVTVAGAAQTLDADGKATVTTESGKEVKLKAKRGYVIEKVEAKKGVAAAARTLSEATAEDLGKIVGADGNIYDTKADAEAVATGNAVAMIAYVGSGTDNATYQHGLAIALSDEGKMNWSTAKSTCEGKTAVTGAWCLPSQNQWKAMLKANGGNDSSYYGLNTAIVTAGGTALQEDAYWSSTENGENYAYYVSLLYGDANFPVDGRSNRALVRACLAF